jgi:hypothetical protein
MRVAERIVLKDRGGVLEDDDLAGVALVALEGHGGGS